ncbi:MAG: hypothetical protein ACLFWL_02765 [Candidatus Brocadiia bacterium]
MQQIHREKQDLWEQVRTTFMQGGIAPNELSSLSVSKSIRDVLQRIGSGPWYPQRNPETGEYDVETLPSTDWLVDQIVYRLYGLTEEEVRVVEGAEN